VTYDALEKGGGRRPFTKGGGIAPSRVHAVQQEREKNRNSAPINGQKKEGKKNSGASYLGKRNFEWELFGAGCQGRKEERAGEKRIVFFLCSGEKGGNSPMQRSTERKRALEVLATGEGKKWKILHKGEAVLTIRGKKKSAHDAKVDRPRPSKGEIGDCLREE